MSGVALDFKTRRDPDRSLRHVSARRTSGLQGPRGDIVRSRVSTGYCWRCAAAWASALEVRMAVERLKCKRRPRESCMVLCVREHVHGGLLADIPNGVGVTIS